MSINGKKIIYWIGSGEETLCEKIKFERTFRFFLPEYYVDDRDHLERGGKREISWKRLLSLYGDKAVE